MTAKSAKNELQSTVRKLRVALDQTQEEFAQRLGVTRVTVARYEQSRPPAGKALAALEELAAEHGLDDYATVFRRALTDELGAPRPEPSQGPQSTIRFKDGEEEELCRALLDVLRKRHWVKRRRPLREILAPVVQERQQDAEFFEAIKASMIGIVRLLKKGHGAEDIQHRLALPAEKIAEALFEYGGGQLVMERRSEVVGLLLKDRWGINDIAERFGGEASEYANIASELGFHRAVHEYEESREEDQQQDAKK